MKNIKKRSFWLQSIEKNWRRPILWISGVRRVGNTCLCHTIADVHYFDCELPRIRRMMEDPENFWNGLRRQRVILDEIHRLGNPSEILHQCWARASWSTSLDLLLKRNKSPA